MKGVLNADPLVRAGQRVGKYILGEPIARGGMAEVWAARVEGPRGFVKSLALKFILDSFAGDSDLERLFENEARLAAQLQHANLVSVFDFDKISDGSGRGRYFIAMERIEGHDLRRVLQNLVKRGRRLSPEIALHIAGEVLKGLRYVHERRDPDTQRPLGLVHRDVSPHNILIGMGGEVKLSDFGIAKSMTQSLGTKAGMIRGKLAYASPEQLRSEPFDHRSDQFALGVTVWEALAGQRLFDGTSEMDIISKVLRCQIPPLPAHLGVAPATEAVLRHMLAAHPDGRYPSTAEAFSALLACPGYTPDGGALEALMQEVFAPQSLELPLTLPLDAALGPPPRVGSGTTKPALDAAEAAGPPPHIVAFPGNTTPAVEQQAAGGGGRRPLGDGIPVPRPPEGGVPDSTTFADRESSVSGSAYVSTADGVPPGAAPRRAPRVAGVAAASIAGMALVFLVARRPWQSPGPGGPAPEGARPRPALVRPPVEPAPPARILPPVVNKEVPNPGPPATPVEDAEPRLERPTGDGDARPSPGWSPHEKHLQRPGHVSKPPPISAPLAAPVHPIRAPENKEEDDPPLAPKPGPPSAAVTTNGSWVLP